MIVSPDRSFAITAFAGDKLTGIKGGTGPRCRKGPVAVSCVRDNGTLLLFPLPEPKVPEGQRLTRFLLSRRSKGFIYSELSLPRSVHKSGSDFIVDSWEERIMIEPMRYERGSLRRSENPTPPIDVKVVRRS